VVNGEGDPLEANNEESVMSSTTESPATSTHFTFNVSRFTT